LFAHFKGSVIVIIVAVAIVNNMYDCRVVGWIVIGGVPDTRSIAVTYCVSLCTKYLQKLPDKKAGKFEKIIEFFTSTDFN
jgi:hypothetical protein